MSLRLASNNIVSTAPDRGHDLQFLGYFFEGGILWEPGQSVDYRLLVGHTQERISKYRSPQAAPSQAVHKWRRRVIIND